MMMHTVTRLLSFCIVRVINWMKQSASTNLWFGVMVNKTGDRLKTACWSNVLILNDDLARLISTLNPCWRYSRTQIGSLWRKRLVTLKNCCQTCTSLTLVSYEGEVLHVSFMYTDFISDLRRLFEPMFSIAVVTVIDDESTVESSSVEINIENHLPKVRQQIDSFISTVIDICFWF